MGKTEAQAVHPLLTVVETEAFGDTPAGRQVFRFEALNANS